MTTRMLTAVLCAVALTTSPATAQQSAARFDAPVVVADEFHRFETTLDLDGDGWQDALDWWWTDDDYDTIVVTGWLNDQTGKLVEAWDFTLVVGDSLSLERFADAGDFDGDSRDDFALAFRDDVWVYTSNGAVAPTLLATWDTPVFEFAGFVVADFDGDGLDDVGAMDNTVTLYRNAGDGTFPPFEPSWNPSSPIDMEWKVGDLDQDGDLDLAKIQGTLLAVRLLEDGLYVGSVNYVHGMASDPDNLFTIGDIDADGNDDVVVFEDGTGNAVHLIGRNGGLIAGPIVQAGPATDLADVNGDGFLDGVCCGGGGDGLTRNVWASHYMISLNDGTGKLTPAFAIENIGSHHLAGAVDLDHDGDLDLVAGRTVYYPRGPITGPPHVGLNDQLGPGGSAGFDARFLNDCEGDGDLDIGFGVDGVLAGWGDGSFESHSVAAPAPPTPPAEAQWWGPGLPGDFDGDGDQDLIVTRATGFIFPIVYEGNYLLVNNGAGVLSNAGPCNDGTLNIHPGANGSWGDPGSSRVVDLDDDGDLDLIVHSSDLGAYTRLWLNDGNGYFVHAGDLNGGVRDVADLDGDGDLDLVVNNSGLEVHFAVGRGSFGAPVPLATPMDYKDTAAVIDVDSDGDLDIVAPRNASTLIHTWLNDGAGGFTLSTVTFAGYKIHENAYLSRAIAGDVDGDGLDDLLLFPVNHASNSAYVFVKKPGQPGFHEPVIQTFEPTGLGDVDGDGDADLLARAEDAGTDMLVLNTTWHGEGAGIRVQYGYGSAGTGGVVPVMGASGPFRLGEQAAIHFTGLPPGSLGILSVSQVQTNKVNQPWLGTTGYNWPWLFFFYVPAVGGTSGEPGSASLTIPFTVDQVIVDVGPLYHQGYWGDPGHPFGISSTNGVFIDYE